MRKCISFNILGSDGKRYPQVPLSDVRFPKVVEILKKYDPDIFCIQEATQRPSACTGINWCEDLVNEFDTNGKYGSMTYHDLANVEKQNLARGFIIFYKRELFDLLENGFFDYSSEEKQPRGFIWAKLFDKEYNRNVWVTDTHWSINWDQEGNVSLEAGDEWRTRQARELLAFYKEKVGDDVLFGCGDYNCNKTSKWHEMLSEDIYKDAAIVVGNESRLRSIDHCFVNTKAVKVLEDVTLRETFEYEGEESKPSDHFPIMTTVEYINNDEKEDGHEIKCVSFNVLPYDNEKTASQGVAPTDIRFPKIIEMLNELDGDVICIQESTGGKARYNIELIETITAGDKYKYVQYGELSGEKQNLARGLVIFYKPELFELLDKGYHNYSSEEKQPRAFIWVKLLDKKTGKNLFVSDTHWSINWDSEGNPDVEAGDEWRTRQANELLAFFKETVGDNALFACGDYNCRFDSKWQLILSENNQGKYLNAATVLNMEFQRIDHCFVNPSAATVVSLDRINNTFVHEGTTYKMSDHAPIIIKQKL